MRNPSQNNSGLGGKNNLYSREYKEFKGDDEGPEKTFYEKAALYLTSKIDLGLEQLPGMKNYFEGLDETLDTARMDVGSREVLNLLLIPSILILILNIFLTFYNPSIAIASWAMALFYIYWILSYPRVRADVTRIKIADESLDLMLNLSMNLRVNSSLVNAIRKSSQNVGGYLGRDISKMLWNLETEYRDTLASLLSDKMIDWRKYSPEFVESLEFLVDSSTLQGPKRTKMIDRGQNKMISDVKEKMSQFARNLSSPVKVLNMVGIMLPLMGLIMFPLITVFLGGEQSIGNLILYLTIGYTVVLPLLLFLFVKRLISRRPGAYKQPSLNNVKDLPPKNKIVFDYKGNTYKFPLLFTSFLVGFTVALPGLIYYMELFYTMLTLDTSFVIDSGAIEGINDWEDFIDQQYQIDNLVSNVIQGITLIWGISAGIITYTYGRSHKRIKLRRRIKNIDDKMVLTITELRNEVSKNKPIEKCFNSVIEKFNRSGLDNHALHDFFSEGFRRMNNRNMPFNQAIFGDDLLQNYPSPVLINTMEIISNSIGRGPKAIEENLKNVRKYVENQEEIERTISELLDEVVSQMEIQAKFIAPIITAAAGTMALIIVNVLFQLSEKLDQISRTLTLGTGAGTETNISENIALIQNLDSALPPTILILVTGLYLIEISLILSYFTNGIRHGFDEISRDLTISKFLVIAVTLYSILVLVTTVFITPMIPGLIEGG